VQFRVTEMKIGPFLVRHRPKRHVRLSWALRLQPRETAAEEKVKQSAKFES
jgi:hypothetical protein